MKPNKFDRFEAEDPDSCAGYGDFAEAYDALTVVVPYDEIADYYSRIIREMTDGTRVLDIGCGTGNLTVRLAEKGFEVTGMDASPDMLMYAAQKSADIMWISRNMDAEDFGVRADAVISTLDSINHLSDKAAAERCFRAAAQCLESGGAFVFDVNTVFKHREVLAENTFVYDVDGVYCVWNNTFDPGDNGVDIDLDLFFEREDGSYERGGESFREIAFTEDELREMLKRSGFEAVNVWEYLAFSAPTERSEKLLVAARRTGA